MSSNPQIRINLTANTPAFAAVQAGMAGVSREAKNASAYVASTGRNVDSLRTYTTRAGQAARQTSTIWERARATVSRMPEAISRSSREAYNLARNARRAKEELKDAGEAGKNLQQALGIGLGVNLVDRVMSGFTALPRLGDELVQRGLIYNEMMESGAARFEQALGGMQAARARMQELSDFGALTPFELPELVEASVVLQQLTRGVLATGDGLTMVGDAAAYANRPLEELSIHIGRAYDGLMSGRAIGMSLMRLQELGLISGDVRNEIEQLQKEGLKGEKVWGVLAEQLGKYAGQMDKLSATQKGLKANLQDIEDATLGQITVPVFEARGKGMAELIKAMEQMDLTPLIALGETWANATRMGYAFAEIMAKNSGLVAAVVRVGGAVIAGGTIVATARASHALLAAYAAWVRANYAQATYGKQATVTANQTTTQTAALNANTIAVNNNALAKRAAASANAAAASSEAMTAGRRTAWQLQNGGAVPPVAQQARGNRGLRGAGALVGGGTLAGAAVATAGVAIGAEWIIADYGARTRKWEERQNKHTAELNAAINALIYPESEEERQKNLLDALAKQADAQEPRYSNRVSPEENAKREVERKEDVAGWTNAVKRLDRLGAEGIAEIAGRRAEIEKQAADVVLRGQYKDWIDKNAEDIGKDFEKTRLSTLNDVERLAEIRQRLVSGPAALSKSGTVDVDVSAKNARELTQVILPQLQAQIAELDAASLEYTRLEVAIKMVQEWATELKDLEAEMGNLDARAASNAATAEDMRLERQIAAARLAGNDALVEQLEHSREMLRVEQQIEQLVKSNVLSREEASDILKGMVDDTRALREQEKARAQATALRDEAGELAVLQLRAQGHDKEADKLERKLRLEKEVAEVVKATGRSEDWARGHLEARARAEDKIKERKEAEDKAGKSKDTARRRPERNWRINQSGQREYRTLDGEWKRPEDMSHVERRATGSATFVRDGAAAVGMRPGSMDTAEDRFSGRNAFAPAAPSTADAALAAINSLAPGMVTPAQPAAAPVAAAPAPALAAAPVAAPSALPAAAAKVSSAADNAAGEVTALGAVVEAGFERIAAAAAAADQTLSRRIDAVAAQVKANRN